MIPSVLLEGEEAFGKPRASGDDPPEPQEEQ